MSQPEVAVLSAVRTAIGKAKKGSLKDTRPDDLLGVVFRGALASARVSPAAISRPERSARERSCSSARLRNSWRDTHVITSAKPAKAQPGTSMRAW